MTQWAATVALVVAGVMALAVPAAHAQTTVPVTDWAGLVSAVSGTGSVNVTVMNDITIPAGAATASVAAGTKVIDGGGYTITAAASGGPTPMFSIAANGNLTFANGTLDGNKAAQIISDVGTGSGTQNIVVGDGTHLTTLQNAYYAGGSNPTNYGGGAIGAGGSNLTINGGSSDATAVVFRNNVSGFLGGGIYIARILNVNGNVIFDSNIAQTNVGGAVASRLLRNAPSPSQS